MAIAISKDEPLGADDVVVPAQFLDGAAERSKADLASLPDAGGHVDAMDEAAKAVTIEIVIGKAA